jgi:hypothetical protein
MIEMGDDLEPTIAGRRRMRAIRFLGTFFRVLAGVTGSVGVLWLIATFRTATWMRVGDHELLTTIGMLGLPMATMVAGTWLLFRIGRGLRDGSPIARWTAVALITPCCIPPLVLFFSAVRNGVYPGAAVAIALLIPPAWAVLLLSASSTDPLFGWKAPVVAAGPAKGPSATETIVESAMKLMVAIFVMTVVLGLIASFF